MKRPSRKILALAAVFIAALTTLAVGYEHFIEDGNFAIHAPNEVYRSGTLSAHEWKEVQRKHPFQSVLNLRGESEGAEWFEREQAAGATREINFYTFGLSANHQPTLEQMEVLVEIMRAAPKPLLIHCKSGSDRTGLALALYSYAIQGKSAEESAKQLSLRYGHFPWLTSRTGAMDAAFAAYVAAHPPLRQSKPDTAYFENTEKQLANPSQQGLSKTMNTPINPQTRIGHIHLKVADLDRALAFYQGILGFELTQRFGRNAAFLGAGGYHHYIGLNTWESKGGKPPAAGTTGLYHTAILYPTRASLADALARLIKANYPITGAADHGVSQAIYLNDPDGNGVELYWDYPQAQWPVDAEGNLAMTTDPLDLEDLLSELNEK